MKTIYIIRHAKSSWKFINLKDRERPLNKRGYQSASLIGNALLKKNITLDLIISSPATRALSTAQIIATVLQYKIRNINIDDDFYTFSDSGKIIFKKLQSLPDQIKSVAIFGHNSTLENIAHKVSNGSIYHFPTCAVLALKFNNESWNKIDMNQVKTEFLITPKQLEDKFL